MTLFYLVNFPDPDIQNQAWQLLSRTISIFLAVLISKSTKEILCEILSQSCENKLSEALSATSEPHHETTRNAILMSFSRWLIFWLIFQIYLFNRSAGHGMIASSKLGGHIVAFSGLDAFTALQAGPEPFTVLRATALNSFFLAMSVGVVLWLILEIATNLRRMCYRRRNDQGSKRSAVKEWMKECSAAENEAASLIVGLLLSQTIRHAISGEHPPIHGGDPKGKNTDQVFVLFLVALVLGALVMKLEMVLKTLLSSPKHKKGIARLIRVSVDTVSMAMAWSLLYWGEWFIYNQTNDRGVGE
jgi:hypothetical protein